MTEPMLHGREEARSTIMNDTSQNTTIENSKALLTFENPPKAETAQRRNRVNRMLMLKRRRSSRGSGYLGRRLGIAAIIVGIVLLVLSSSMSGAAYAYYQTQLPLLNKIADHNLAQTTRIYDRNGAMLAEIYDQRNGHGRRTYVDYKDISPLLVNATVAAEDRTFWTNNGVDPQGILRAAYENSQSNSVVGGGSTITQQLIKYQLFLGTLNSRNIQVKGQEAVLAYGLTQQYPKWKIMEMYLNTVFYGNLNYGVEAAAQNYFGLKPKCDANGKNCKPAVSQLTLAQASLLAGLPQGPSLYSPASEDNRPAAQARQKIVLQAMIDENMITLEQAQKAKTETKKMPFKAHNNYLQKQAPHFVNYVIDTLASSLGEERLLNGGYNIYTTLDLDLQKKVEQVSYDNLYKPVDDFYQGHIDSLSGEKNVNNTAAVVMNPKTGEILAMNGSASYTMNTPQVQGQTNAAVAALQPGSSFKPIVYATAFEMGWYPGMAMADHKTNYPYPMGDGTYYSPNNYDLKFHGNVTVRKALANSLNVPAVSAIMYTGIPNVVNMAGRLGLKNVATHKSGDFGASTALGTIPESLLNMTGAYATFANQGVRVAPVPILQIDDSQGKVMYKYDAAHPKGQEVIRKEVAYLMTNILSDTEARHDEFGAGNPLELLDRPVAAKTGTTENYADNWTIGYTPYLAVGVWAGNSDHSYMNNVIGVTGAGPIWHQIIDYASKKYNLAPDNFPRPDNIVQGTVSSTTGLQPDGTATVNDLMIDGTQPSIQGSNSSLPPAQTPPNKGGPGNVNIFGQKRGQ